MLWTEKSELGWKWIANTWESIVQGGALDRARRWKEVLELFQLQQQLQVQPNVVFCGHALGAMASSVQWRPSLALLAADLGASILMGPNEASKNPEMGGISRC
eukprot:s1584_g17.t1